MRKPWYNVMSVGLCSVGLWCATAGAAPKIEFEKTTYDFGTTSAVTAVTGTFRFKNAGDAELVIGKPATSCGCTTTGVKPDKLQPGEGGELTFTLSVGGGRGPMQKNITVPTNDPTQPQVTLAIRVEMLQAFQISPQSVNLGQMRAGTETNFVIAVRRTDDRPLGLQSVTVKGSRLTAEVKPVAGDDKAAEIHVHARMGDGFGTFNEQIQGIGDSTGQPLFTVVVFGQQLADVMVVPERLFWAVSDVQRLPASRLDQVLTRNFQVTGTVSNQNLEVTAVRTDVKGLELQVVTIEPQQKYQIIAKFQAMPTESARGTITVETNLASVPRIDVPAQVTVIRRQ